MKSSKQMRNANDFRGTLSASKVARPITHSLRRRGATLLAAAVAVFAAGGAHAGQLFTTTNSTEPWDLTTTDWGTSSGVDSGSVWTNNSDAVFEAFSGTVTIGASGVTANSLTFNSSGYLINGSTLTLSGTAAVTVTTGTDTIGSVITGSAGLAANGSGTLILTGVDNYTGGTTVSNGTLNIGGGGTTGSIPTTSITVASGATLAYNYSSSFSATPLSVTGNLSYTSGAALTLPAGTYGGNTFTASATGGTASTEVIVGGNLIINAGAGGATINGSTASGGSGFGGITSGAARNITTTGNVTFNGTTTTGSAFIDGISLGGTFTATTGTLTFKGIAAVNGAYGMEQGASGVFAQNITTVGNVVFDGTGGSGPAGGNSTHTGDLNLGPLTGNGTVTLIGRKQGLSNNGTFTASGGAYNVLIQTFNGASINGLLGAGTDTTSNGNYTINSAGSVTFGGRTINAGTGTISLTSVTGYSVTSSSTLQASALTMGDSNGIAISSGATLTLNTTGTIGNGISSAGALAVTGGAITLSGANGYSGGTTITMGTVKMSGSGVLGSTSGTLTLTSGTLDLNATSQTVGAISGAGTVDNTSSSPVTFTIGNGSSTTTTFSGPINQSGGGTVSLVKSGTGTTNLTGASTYSGPTTVNLGTLGLGSAGTFPSTVFTVGSGATPTATAGNATLQINGARTLGTASAGSLTVNGGNTGGSPIGQGTLSLVDGTPNTLNLANNSGATSFTFGGASGNPAVLAVEVGATSDQIALASGATASIGAATNVVNLTGLGSLSGTQQTLISAPGGLAAGSFSNFSIGTVGGNTSGFAVSLSSDATHLYLVETVDASPTPTIAYFKGNLSSFWGSLVGTTTPASNWTSDSNGGTDTNQVPGATTDVHIYTTNATTGNLTTTLGQNFTINSLTVEGGSLTSAISIAPGGGTLTITPTSPSTALVVNLGAGAVTISAPVALGASQTWTNNSANTLTVSGNVTGVGSALTTAGTGTISLTGTNNYSGGTNVSAGTLNVGIGGTTGTIPTTAITVALGAKLAFNLSTAYTAAPLSVSGNIAYTSGAQLIMSGTYGGNQITASGVNVSVNGTLTLNGGAGNSTINGSSTSAAGINWPGTHNLTATGNVTLTGTSTAGSFIDGISASGVLTDNSGTLTLDGTAAAGAAYGIEDGVSGSYGGSFSTFGTVVFKGTGGTTRNSDLNVGPLTGNGTVTLLGRSKGLNTNSTFTSSGGLPYNVIIQTTGAGVGINGLLGAGTDTTGGGNYTINATGTVVFGGRTINAGAGTLSLTTGTGYSVTVSSNLTAAALTMGDTKGIALTSGATLTLNTTGTIPNIISSAGALSITGGAVTLTGQNSYAGSTTITGGSLLIGTGGKIPTASNLILNGGTFNTNGIGQTSTGTLALTNNSSIDFGSGNNILTLGASSGVAWTVGKTLTILDWNGSQLGGTNDQFYVGGTSGGLSTSQLAQITFSGFTPGAQQLNTGEIVPVPEPTVIGLIALAGVGLLAKRRRVSVA